MMHFFTAFPDDWLAGTTDLSTEETGAYWNLICFYMLKDGQVPDDDRLLSRITKLSMRRWRTVKTRLIDGGHIEVRDGFLWQRKCEERLEKDGSFAKKQGEKAKKRWAKERANALENNKTIDATGDATPAPAPSPSPNDYSSSRQGLGDSSQPSQYAFAGAVIRLTHGDFARWQRSFCNIPNIMALLEARDTWLSGQPDAERKKWFVTTPRYLANKDNEYAAQAQRAVQTSRMPMGPAGG